MLRRPQRREVLAMRDLLTVTEIAFTPAEPGLRATGLLGWASATIRGLRIDGIAIRRTQAGRIAAFFPERADRTGRVHRVVWPVDPVERDSISRALLAALRQRGALP